MSNQEECQMCDKIKNCAIPANRAKAAMPAEVREFAEMLAEIAAQQLRLQTQIIPGDLPHE